jgi:hypothetical protein
MDVLLPNRIVSRNAHAPWSPRSKTFVLEYLRSNIVELKDRIREEICTIPVDKPRTVTENMRSGMKECLQRG